MIPTLRRAFVLLVAITAAVRPGLSEGAKPEAVTFVFNGTDYFDRWSENGQHEFTPAKQEDLDHWSDMITVNEYPDAGDGDALAMKANAVLENYKNHEAKILKTSSVPRTADHPAEHLIAAMFQGIFLRLFASNLRRQGRGRDERVVARKWRRD
jgi:hypothetical protein